MKNMSRFSRILFFAAALAAVASCGRSARMNVTVGELPSSEVIVKQLELNVFKTLDTVATDEAGRFAYKVEIEKGQPEFVYLFHGGKKIASLILQA